MEFPQSKEKIIGYLEMAAGLGLTVGPFMSGIVYSYLHYAGTFLFFAIILASTGVFLFSALPNKLNRSSSSSSQNSNNNSSGDEEDENIVNNNNINE